MITNKIISIIISITGIIVIPAQIITTFVLGILVSLTFGLPLILFSAIWIALFYGPLLGLSYMYEQIVIARPFISIVGIPLAIIGNTFVTLIPSMGELESRFIKLIYCQSFPYTWRFHQFYTRKLYITQEDVLNKVLKEISTAVPLGEFIAKLKLNNLHEQKGNIMD